MPRSTLFVAVTLLLLGHIYCVPIDTADETTDPSPPASGPHHDTKLKVNNDNEVLGDIPIVPDHQVEITNRRSKLAIINIIMHNYLLIIILIFF